MLAAEMFRIPAQCRFDLVLDPDAPALTRYALEVFLRPSAPPGAD
jgi:hypothetical protein